MSWRQSGLAITYLITLRLRLSLPATCGAHGATSDVTGRGMGGRNGGFWTVRTGSGDMGSPGVVKVGQPSSPDGFIGRSPKRACMRHAQARRGRSQQKLGGRGDGGESEKE